MSARVPESPTVPPGFRFHPTDEELVSYYLQKKVACQKIDLDVIKEVDLYRMEPWDLQERCRIGTGEQHEWYFFSHKDKKYPTGTRTNRATVAGFWKATGRDKPIFSKYKIIGMRKTLVFYRGRAPNGQKTDWIMHEYRVEDESSNSNTSEEGWVVCRVFKKRLIHRRMQDEIMNDSCCYEEQVALLPELESPEELLKETSCHKHSFICKGELLDLDEYEPDRHQSFSFTLFPQPGSPSSSTTSYTHCHESRSSVVGFILESCSNKVANDHPQLPLLFELPELDDEPSKPKAAGSEHDDQFINGGTPVTQWTVVDRLVADQLGQCYHADDTAKLDPTSTLSIVHSTPAFSESIIGEVAPCNSSLGKLPLAKASLQLDHSSHAGEMDLWSAVVLK